MPVKSGNPTVLLVGAGSLGRSILSELSRSPHSSRVVATSRQPEQLEKYLNLLRMRALAQGCQASLESIAFDLDHPSECAEKIADIDPEIIIMTATRQTWWLSQLLPQGVRDRLGRAGYGHWLPIHLDLTQRLMRVLAGIDYRGMTLTSSYPDVTNCLLSKQGLAPFSGFGNVAEIVNKLRLAASCRYQVPASLIGVRLAAHHALQVATFGTLADHLPPYALEIEVPGEGMLGPGEMRELLLCPLDLPAGPETHVLTAACAVEVIRVLLAGSEEIVHVPGPRGLPGGYPVRFRDAKIEVLAVAGQTEAQLIELNRASHAFDGIDTILDDGTVVFTERGVDIFDELMGYRCPRLEPAAVREQADDLIRRFRELADRQGVDLDSAV